MAGAGYKLFNTGDVLTAAQVNTYLQEQAVMRFANATARTNALSGVLAEGMVSYLDDTNAVEVYDGSNWISIGAAGDITGVTAGTGISGGGTSGTVTITNDMATTITAAGDIVIGTGSGTYDNLPIGTTGQVLTADTTVSPYKVKWASAGGGFSNWTAYTPTWTNLTVGNGTVTARYTESNKVVITTLELVFGSTTSITSNNPRFSLPVTAVSASAAINRSFGSYWDANNLHYPASCEFFSTTAVNFQTFKSDSTYVQNAALTTTAPFTWGTGDYIYVTTIYEAA